MRSRIATDVHGAQRSLKNNSIIASKGNESYRANIEKTQGMCK